MCYAQTENSALLNRLPFSMGEEDNAEISADGKTLFMNWSEGPVPRSSYDSVWLRTLADIAGDQVRASIPGDADVSTVSDSAWFDWLEYPVGLLHSDPGQSVDTKEGRSSRGPTRADYRRPRETWLA